MLDMLECVLKYGMKYKREIGLLVIFLIVGILFLASFKASSILVVVFVLFFAVLCFVFIGLFKKEIHNILLVSILSAFLGAFASISLNNYAERLRKQEIVKSTLASVVIEASLNLGILKTIQPVLLQTGPYIPFYRLSDSILKNALSNTDFSESRTVADKVILSMILGECGVINNQLDGMTYNSFSVKDENKKNLETVAESLEKKLNLILKKYPRPSWGNKAELDWLGEGGIIFTK